MFQGKPSLYPAKNFNSSNDAAALKNDAEAFVNVFCKRSFSQRLEIAKVYETNHGKKLTEKIKSETFGSFQDLLLALLKPTIEFITSELHDAMSGTGTDEAALLDIMPAMSNAEMRQVASLFKEKYGKSLAQALTDDLSGGFQHLMVTLSKANRDESFTTHPKNIRADASALKSALETVDEKVVNTIFCERNFEQIKLIANDYRTLTGKNLEEDFKANFSGDHKSGLKSILKFALSPQKFFASRLQKAIVGIGTNDKTLNRIVATRCEIDMENIKEEYKKAFGETLRTAIGSDTTGDFKHALYTLINEREKPQTDQKAH